MIITAASRAGGRRRATSSGASRPATTARNRIINGALQISQENGNSSATTDAYYVADQFSVHRVTSAGTITAQRVQSVTPGGALDRARITITTQDASLAAGEYLYLRSRLEGQNVADFRYGSASAKQAILRFLFKGPAGIYAVSITNSATNRSYVATFSPAAANTDEIITLAVPGDTSGTWLTDTGIGLEIRVVLACGSTFQGTTGWQAGNILGTSGVSNGMGTSSAVFEFGEFGLYLDASSTGLVPVWEMPNPLTELGYCKTFFQKSYAVSVVPGTSSASDGRVVWVNSGTGGFGNPGFVPLVPMRTIPSITLYSPATGSANTIRSESGIVDVGTGTSTALVVGDNSWGGVSGTRTSGDVYSAHYVANARL